MAKPKSAVPPHLSNHPTHNPNPPRRTRSFIGRVTPQSIRKRGGDRGSESMGDKPGVAAHEPLLPSRPQGTSAEAKRLLRLAGPIVASCVLQNVVNMASVMFVGHLGNLPLAGASLATSLANVTGYSLLVRPSGRYLFASSSPVPA